MTIGQVLERVKPQFPALTISKIRFLENEGLLSPWRNPAGYRKYSLADIERLRYILAEQRDSYRPLKVILEQLRALDAGHEVDRVPTARLVADRGKTQLPATDHVSVRQLCDLTGTSKSDIEQFVQLGLINPDLSGYFATRCVHVVNLILALRRQGIAPRNLRVVRNSAERTADLIDQSVESMRARGRAGDIERARAQSQELAELTADLQREFLRLAIDKLSQ
ncbi:MAG: MerR family transcriptional regulator [Actinomycetaceae bacterium]|nr:MerR family transcriptional regulator [Actinomycetaceae bacterium]